MNIAILITDKIDFKTKAIRDKEGSSNFTSEYLSKETQNTNSKRYMHSCIYYSIIYNSQDNRATQEPIDRRMSNDKDYFSL